MNVKSMDNQITVKPNLTYLLLMILGGGFLMSLMMAGLVESDERSAIFSHLAIGLAGTLGGLMLKLHGIKSQTSD